MLLVQILYVKEEINHVYTVYTPSRSYNYRDTNRLAYREKKPSKGL